MTRRLLIAAAALGLLAAACANGTQVNVALGSGTEFVPQVMDFLDNVGVDPSIALDAKGVPYVAYFGFHAEPKPGALPVTRPIYAPFVPSVMLASQSGGIVTRGAVAMALDPNPGITIPYGPATIPSLKDITSANVNGVDVALDAQGGLHAIWASDDGYWYASEAAGGTVAATHLVKYYALTLAGPFGSPAVAVDGSGNPWVAFTYVSDIGQQVVRVGTETGGKWSFVDVANIDVCEGCPQPEPTGLAVRQDGTVFVAYTDTATKTPMLASLPAGDVGRGKAHVALTPLERRAGGEDVSLVLDKNGAAHVAYYAAGGEVHEAVIDDHAPQVNVVGTWTKGPNAAGMRTSVAVDDQGTSYVAWYDPGADQVDLASGTGGTFAAIATKDTGRGSSPSVAATPDGSKVFLAWYDDKEGNLELGTYANVSGLDLALANPSPTPTAAQTTAPATCQPSGTKLKIAAPPGAGASGFDINCLAVTAGQTFSLTFDNQDPGATGTHNVSVYTSATDTTTPLFSTGAPAPGPYTKTITEKDGGNLKPDTYFFRCDVHTTTMTGSFVVAK